MNQESLFHEDIWQALTDCVRALGGAKAVGHKMRPELDDPEKAGRWVLDCLNPARNDKFCLEQIVYLLREAREIGCHVGMNYIAGIAGYSAPQPIEPEDELGELQRAYIESVKQQGQLVKRIEAANARTPARKR